MDVEYSDGVSPELAAEEAGEVHGGAGDERALGDAVDDGEIELAGVVLLPGVEEEGEGDHQPDQGEPEDAVQADDRAEALREEERGYRVAAVVEHHAQRRGGVRPSRLLSVQSVEHHVGKVQNTAEVTGKAGDIILPIKSRVVEGNQEYRKIAEDSD